MARSLNKVMLIGNLTRDPELRYTAQGTAVCNFGLATNRYWTTETGEKKEDTEFHRIVSWNKLAELCSQLLAKGRKVYVEGRLQTRSWTGADGNQRTTTEIVISDMVILDSRRAFDAAKMAGGARVKSEEIDVSAEETPALKKKKEEKKREEKVEQKEEGAEEEKVGEGERSGVSAGKTDDQGKKKADQDEEQKKAKKEEEEEKVSPDEIPF